MAVSAADTAAGEPALSIRSVTQRMLGGGLFALKLYGTALVVLTHATELINARFKSEASLPPQVAAALRKNGCYCGDDELLLRYSTVVTAHPDFSPFAKKTVIPELAERNSVLVGSARTG